MYRVFECLDQLNHIVEEARGVPMSQNCMVPRHEVQALLDELRNALPVEIDDAQDVLDNRDAIIDDAELQATRTIRESEEEADRLVDEAQVRSDRMIEDSQKRAHAMVEDAKNRSQTMVSEATAESEKLVTDAQNHYRQATERAAAEAKRLIDSGNEAYDRSISEAIAEQRRLVSESEVVRESQLEARRISEEAHADSSRLRSECDTFVDQKLAEFEDALQSTLRTVSRDRTALRQGAGASGYSTGGPSSQYSGEDRTYERSQEDSGW